MIKTITMYMTPSNTLMRAMLIMVMTSLGLLSATAQNQAFSKLEKEAAQALQLNAKATVLPEKFNAFNIDQAQFSTFLMENAPVEFQTKHGLEIDFPMPDGSSQTFEVWRSSIMEEGLQAKYPNIRSYAGRSTDNPQVTLRMTISQIGVKVAIKEGRQTIYIDPIVQYSSDAHASYYINDLPSDHEHPFICGTEDHDHNPLAGINPEDIKGGVELRSAGNPVGIRTFRAAIAATGEWTLREGSKANAVAKIASSVDRANLLFEAEVAFRLILVDNNDVVVFEDPDTDPYAGGSIKVGADLISVNTGHLNRLIGVDNYDFGHVYTLRCQMVGGIARRSSVCDDNNKGAGTTCWSDPNLESTVIRVFCHEAGHQFSANHTFNHCDRDNENLPTGYEPGSGSTIMSYAGGCGNQNVQSSEDPYYHCNTLMAMYGFSRSITCGSEIATGNTRPDVAFDHENGFTIPISTPFFLRGTGMDMEGDDLLYCIEQHDAGTKICDLGSPEGSCPAFRSFPPNERDYRVFPRFTTTWNNQKDKNEVLVDYSREFNFVITARDNNAEVGGFGMDTVTFNAVASAGPFVVTYPNNGEGLTANKYEEITWDVANTDAIPVNCQYVDILMHRSTDFEDYQVLKAQTENDGSAWVLMPDTEMEDVRITVVASDNIFFDISDRNSDITASTDTTYSLGLLSNSSRVCLPDVFETEILASSLGGYQGTITLDIVSGLPSGATYNFGSNTIESTGSTTLLIDLTDVTENGVFTVVLEANSNGTILTREITLETVNSDFSSLVSVTPGDGDMGIVQSTNLTWSAVDDADLYDVQIASNPSFDGGSLIQENLNVAATTISLDNPLEKNTLYFWRVRAKNICGTGDWTVPAAFATEAAVCNEYEAPDKNVNVPKGNTTSFELNIAADAEIIDLNVSKIDFFCDFLSDAVVSLESPQGTEVILANKECGNVTDMLCGFDDDATRVIRCPPNTGQSFQPRGSLAEFNGQNAQGVWKLNLEIASQAVGSELGEWFLEICTNGSGSGPVLVINDTLKTKPGENNPISGGLLRTEDANNGPSELTYILSTVTSEGELLLNGSTLAVGTSLTQAEINSGAFTYNHTGNEDVVDHFVFTVNDGEGGFTGSHTYVIDVNESNPSSTSDLNFEEIFKIFPNPTTSQATMLFDQPLIQPMNIEVTDMNGKMIQKAKVNAGASNFMLNFDGASRGVYFVRAADNERYFTVRVTVQ